MNIAVNNIVSVRASSQNPNFPAELMLDTNPGLRYRAVAGVNFTTIEADVIGGCSDVMLAGTSAVNVEVSGRDPNMVILNNFLMGKDREYNHTGNDNNIYSYVVDGGDSVVDGDDNIVEAQGSSLAMLSGGGPIVMENGFPWPLEDGNPAYQESALSGGGYDYSSYIQGNKILDISGQFTQRSRSESLWITLSEIVRIPIVLTFKILSPKGATAEIGVMTGSIAETYGGRGSNYGVVTSREDYSIEKVNSNGSRYLKIRKIARMFDVQMQVTQENALRLQDNYDETGKTSSAWKLTNLEGSDFVVYGSFVSPPKASHDHPGNSSVSFTLIEDV